MISHADTMTTSIDEHSIGVVESLIKGNPLYYKTCTTCTARISPWSPASDTSTIISPVDLTTTYQDWAWTVSGAPLAIKCHP